MKKCVSILGIIIILLASCSTGKKALQKGDYFSAVSKAVERLKSAPENKNANKVLREGYPMTIEWVQEEMDLILTSNYNFKLEQAVGLMRQVNQMSDLIKSTPAARKIISNPKTYTSELNMATEKEDLKNPDFIVDMEFFDFSVGNLSHAEKEEPLEKRVKIESKDTTFIGDKEALDNNQFELTKRKAVPLPPEQDLFIEFTKPIYSEVTQNLNRFFRKYN